MLLNFFEMTSNLNIKHMFVGQALGNPQKWFKWWHVDRSYEFGCVQALSIFTAEKK